jgi:hypothetical protein
MEIKFDFNSAKETAIAVMRDREKFWAKLRPPKDIGPLVSYLIVIGLAPLLGYLLWGAVAWYMPMGWAASIAVGQYLAVIILPLLIGAIMSIVGEILKAKGKFIDYATIATYSATPSVLAGFLMFLPSLGRALTILGALFGLYLLYLGLVKMLKMKSDQAIIFIIVYLVVWILITSAVTGALVGGGYYAWATGYPHGVVVY